MIELSMTVETKKEYRLGDTIDVIFSLKNEGDISYSILKWETPFDDFIFGAFDVLLNGKSLEYDGALVKRGDPISEDYITLAPKETISITIDLSKYFLFEKTGHYEIKLNQYLLDVFPLEKDIIANTLSEFNSGEITINNASFEVIGKGQTRLTMGAINRIQGEKEVNSIETPISTGQLPLSPVVVKYNTEAHREMTIEAHYEVYEYLQGCICDLNRTPNNKNNHYKMVFGVYDANRYSKAIKVFNDISNALKKDVITYEFDYSKKMNNVYAYTYRGSRKIYLCNLYVKTKMSGCDSKIGTIFHELTHAVSRTDDIKYSRDNCRQLAKNQPDKAINNADSYEFFLESEFTYWDGNVKIKDISNISPESNYNPALVVYKNKIYCIYKGAHSNILYYATYDGSTWSGNKKIKDESKISPESNYNPGVAVYNNLLYIVYKGSGSNTLYYATYDGNTWSGNKKIKDISKISPESNYNPNIAVYKNKMYMVYKGAHSNTLYYACYDGNTWSGNKKIKDISSISPESNYNPGVAVYNNLLYIIYKGSGSNTLYYATYDGNTWSGNKKVSDVSDISPECNYCPRITTIDNMIYIPYKGAYSNTIYQSQLNYSTGISKLMFTVNEKVKFNSDISPETNYDHSIVLFNGHVYTVYKGAHSNTLYFAWQ